MLTTTYFLKNAMTALDSYFGDNDMLWKSIIPATDGIVFRRDDGVEYKYMYEDGVIVRLDSRIDAWRRR